MRYSKFLVAFEGFIFGASMFFFRLDKGGGPEGISSSQLYRREARIYHSSEDYFENERIENNDIIGYLTVDGTDIDYPVMRDRTNSSGNYYYLTHNFRGEPDRSGCPFVRKSQDINDDIVTIYAHNNSNGTMFADLVKFEDDSFFTRYNSIEFDTVEGMRVYKVISVMDVSVYGEDFSFWGWQNFAGTNDEEFFLEQISDLSVNVTSQMPGTGNDYLLLVTCEYSHDNGRRVVVAVRTS